MELKKSKVLVVGMARSGVAAATMLAREAAIVTICDIKQADALQEPINNLSRADIEIVTGGYPPVEGNFDLVIASPGVPADVQPFIQAANVGIPVWSELELAALFIQGPIVAVTGTNGKTTTTALIGEMFIQAGVPTVVGGNIGTPLVGEVQKTTDKHVTVAEVSSFQLEWVEKFHPRVAVILNITPDHLDRHGTMENYIATKARIFKAQNLADYTVLNYDDPKVRKLAAEASGQVIFFSSKHTLKTGVSVDNGFITIKQEEDLQVISVEEVGIKGAHNIDNALAAVAAGWALGLTAAQLKETLAAFPGVEHRLEFVREINQVRYINDSKGTNPDASIKALEAFPNPIILIAGGKNKGSDFSEFAQLIKARAKDVILLGEAADEIQHALSNIGFTRVHQVSDYQRAVPLAEELAEPGDIVLLSPACASWDMFGSYEERGKLFKELVNSLRG
ncbi:UDP-N-acetylmuramoyl-L-alanine--D-glutamate ligase [Metallumcola ferriviriculae]|uniref:UDP-N-acetylmuramoylalanine--D-glutamate ligase n=1 Tax=Metallumcola ferriviriculae TaxID=3039180 RepID=A0AAU0UP79_9FIRM|nr:UDP-N-acetylmuramoyl-L-alanine--D-glutamate ligase [Desulfitibacteraceae bacterium MK1]